MGRSAIGEGPQGLCRAQLRGVGCSATPIGRCASNPFARIEDAAIVFFCSPRQAKSFRRQKVGGPRSQIWTGVQERAGRRAGGFQGTPGVRGEMESRGRPRKAGKKEQAAGVRQPALRIRQMRWWMLPGSTGRRFGTAVREPAALFRQQSPSGLRHSSLSAGRQGSESLRSER